MRPLLPHRRTHNGFRSTVRCFEVNTFCEQKQGKPENESGVWFTQITVFKRRFLFLKKPLFKFTLYKHEDEQQAVLMHDKIIKKLQKKKTLFLRDILTQEKYTLPAPAYGEKEEPVLNLKI